MLVNRLGDRSKKLGSKVVKYIDALLLKHPNWKELVAREVRVDTLPVRSSVQMLVLLHQSMRSSSFAPELST